MASVKFLNSKLAKGDIGEEPEFTQTVTLPDGTTVVKYRCRYCGKMVTKDENVEAASGDYCRHLREDGWDDEALSEHRKSMSATEVPVAEDGRPYLKVASVGRMCEKANIPVARLVKAFGGDRCLDASKVLHPLFTPVYVGKSRYIHPWCGDADGGLAFLKGLAGGRAVSDNGNAPLKGKAPKAAKANAPKDAFEDVLS